LQTDPQPPRIRNILAAIDGSEFAEKAGLFAVELARKYEARLVLLHIANYPAQYLGLTGHDVAVGLPLPSERVENLKKRSRDSIDRIAAIAHDQKVQIRKEFIETNSSVAQSIADYAERESVQMIVVGIRGVGNFDPYVVGSVASDLVSKARCSLLIVR